MRITMHSVAVDGSSVPGAFLSHHQPPQLMQAPTHAPPWGLSKRAAISQPPWQEAASPPLLLSEEPLSPLCGCGSSTSQVDPTVGSRCLRPRLGAPPQPHGSRVTATSAQTEPTEIRNDFVLISLLIWRTPPNVWRSRLIVYRFIYAWVQPWEERRICL